MSDHRNQSGAHGSPEANERLNDLLTAWSTEGLSHLEEVELDRLLRAQPSIDPEEFELAAAATTLAMIDSLPDAAAHEPLPADLRSRLLTLATGEPSAGLAATPPPAAPRPMPTSAVSRRIEPSTLQLSGEPGRSTVTTQTRSRAWPTAGWLAAAAALVIAALGWLRSSAPQPVPTPTLQQQLASFERDVADAVHCPWQGKVAGFEAVSGEVVWSDSQQRGYMTFRGLPSNDPSQKQYQLWIVDLARDKNPVDGGVFDIAATCPSGTKTAAGEVIVPIDSKLLVKSPAAFALTVEKPGGVVVSAGPLVLVASR